MFLIWQIPAACWACLTSLICQSQSHHPPVNHMVSYLHCSLHCWVLKLHTFQQIMLSIVWWTHLQFRRNQFPLPRRDQSRTVNITSKALRMNYWGNALCPLCASEFTKKTWPKVKAWECLTGAEVTALAAASCVPCPSQGHIVCTPGLLLPIRLSIQKCYSLYSGPDSATSIKICPLGTNGKHLKCWPFSSPHALLSDTWMSTVTVGGVDRLSAVKRPQEIKHTKLPAESEKCGTRNDVAQPHCSSSFSRHINEL